MSCLSLALLLNEAVILRCKDEVILRGRVNGVRVVNSRLIIINCGRQKLRQSISLNVGNAG